MRLRFVTLPDDMDRLQGSGVWPSVQAHGRGAGGAPTGDCRHASTGSEVVPGGWVGYPRAY